ncbi:glycosyltransferase family 1 protein [Mesorhizobium sp. YM1C-6-2]|uniref:glycosyltransferase family 1 protein n=1 Tax=Mesorhizobium sp. YM1C-6-2 TaxID=1827501 RepID=UPI001FDF2A38|nr:glycosyltransferase family 1 protein [Mesorhizobium sp. YM1C-6-2]
MIYLEEPAFEAVDDPHVRINVPAPGLSVVTPVLPPGIDDTTNVAMQRSLLDQLLLHDQHSKLVTWYYTPMALPFSAHLRPDICIYDCMDELSGFKDPPARLIEYEKQLFATADLVFTGGDSLYQAKRTQHPYVYAFPSSIDAEHFGKARRHLEDPAGQHLIPHPRIGFFGVIDERMDLGLVASTATSMPDCQFVMLGPVVKIDPATLPRAANLHWLGSKSYDELPSYLRHWSAGWMPFALNESTRFISPTKTPEFLAAGLPVVSTAIADVVRPYGVMGLVGIASSDNIVQELRKALARKGDATWLGKVDAFLAGKSWDKTWSSMLAHISSIKAGNDIVLMQKEPKSCLIG